MRLLPISTLFLIAAPATAAVVSSSANGFHVRHTVPVVVPADEVYALIGQPQLWWSGEHSYSGDAANFRMELRPGGCFCEALEGGGFVEHMRVAAVIPGKQVILTGSLGPLLYAPAYGTLTLTVDKAGAGAKVTLEYKVSGFVDNDGATMAPLVDKVLGEQLNRFRTRAASKGSRAVP